MASHKIAKFRGADNLPHVYPKVWLTEQTSGPQRLVIAPSGHHIDLIIELARQLPEPFGILYVLVVPRGGSADAGRYQNSQPCSRDELESFLQRFQSYFEGDARAHLWISSLSGQAQIIYDNHDIIYAYGPLEEFTRVLKANQLEEGEVRFPSLHTHNYNEEFDEAERQVMDYWRWEYFPLMEGDD